MNQFFQRSIAAAAAVLALTAGLAAGAAETQSISMPILMYHNLTQDPNKTSSMTITDERFRLDMEFLESFGYTPLFPSEVEEIGEGKRSLPARPVMITFDDGYIDNYTTAFPLLKKYGLKATIFVVSDEIGKPGRMTGVQLKEMSDSGLISIQSHTVSHQNLKNLTHDETEYQFSHSKSVIETVTKKPVRALAAPGFWSKDLGEQASRYYDIAFRSFGWGTCKRENRFRVPRAGIFRSNTLAEFQTITRERSQTTIRTSSESNDLG